uniref:Docking protein 2 n=1 Tax=Junco hyemalis TaxID=40217 RepID=A0A8C5IJL7_JUNHY
MEEAVVKQGWLYLQLQQTFGKKWKKFWAMLYRESPCSTARLELQEGPERPRKAEGGRRLVRLSDCVHVAEAGGDASCPKDTVPFLLETTERRFLLAEPGAAKEGTEGEFSMEENSLYSSRAPCPSPAALEQAFEVTVRVTPSSQRCRLRGRCILRAGEEALELWHPQGQELLSSWPYRFLRRFGRDKVTFSFEAGRRCASGEGNFEFDTRQGNEIFQAIEAAIELQRGRGGPSDEAPRPPDHARTPSWVPKGRLVSRGGDCPYAEPHDSLRPPDKGRRLDSARVESEYAVPFDAIAKAFLARQFGALGCAQEGLPEPPSVPRDAQQPPGRPTAPKPEHIYDEPEGLSGLSLYDEPEEVKGEAWRLQAAPEEPPGLGSPYNAQRDDYAVPKRPFLLQGKEWLGDSDYDNVALRVAKKRNLQ